MTAQFSSRDPNHPAFWDERFAQGFIPWNFAAVPQALRDFVGNFARTQRSAPNCLIPGCGHANELGFLCEAGWQVTAIDFSAAAVQAAKSQVGPWSAHVQKADFFEFTPTVPLNLIYERAFFCALPPAMREAVVRRWAELLPSGAKLIGYFLLDEAESVSKKGPPFLTSVKEFAGLMSPYFECIETVKVSDSLAVFEGKEHWQVWRRI
jgi:hypothetical protein